jgi:hypothetical protein
MTTSRGPITIAALVNGVISLGMPVSRHTLLDKWSHRYLLPPCYNRRSAWWA